MNTAWLLPLSCLGSLSLSALIWWLLSQKLPPRFQARGKLLRAFGYTFITFISAVFAWIIFVTVFNLVVTEPRLQQTLNEQCGVNVLTVEAGQWSDDSVWFSTNPLVTCYPTDETLTWECDCSK